MIDRHDLRAAAPGWIAGRVLVAVGWAGAVVLVRLRLDGTRTVAMVQGLFAWDGAYYRAIAERGYAAVGPDATRFHPLFPLLGGRGWGLLVVANAGALLAAAVVHRLCREALADADLARRAATLVGIAPPAFCLVWAYAEGPFLLLSAGQLLALHRRRWWWAAALGALATLDRPTGLLLVVPALATEWRRISPAKAAAVLAPAVAMAGYLAWVGDRFGDAWLPLRVQSDLRGGVAFPPLRLLEGLGEIVSDPFGDGLHVPFAFGLVALAWVARRRLPGPWVLYAWAAVVTTLAAHNLNSIERYGFGTLPLVVALAAVTGGRWWRPAVAASGAALVAMTALAWYGSYVP